MERPIELTLRFRPGRIVRVLSVVAILLVMLSLSGQIVKHVTGHTQMFGFIPKFHLDEESNIPTFFSSFLILVASAILFYIGSWRKRSGESDTKFWMGLSLIFLYLAVDESASLHELCIQPVRSLLNTSGVFHFAWIIPAGVILVFLGIVYLRFLFRLPIRIRRLFITAAVIYVGGAMFGEALGGYYLDGPGGRDMVYTLITTVEESLELVGLLIFIHALFRYLKVDSWPARDLDDASISVVNAPADASRDEYQVEVCESNACL